MALGSAAKRCERGNCFLDSARDYLRSIDATGNDYAFVRKWYFD